ncbi:MAG: hypothetical protein LBT08_04880 [Synergistaceae bacterium]|jgi:hypothetical protein|nr:hypothetical protein [Synergistaceae bacterium]
MRRFFVLLAMATTVFMLISEGFASASDYRVGGNWLTNGGGFAEKGILRIGLSNNGRLTMRSYMDGDREIITGYYMQGELQATGFNIRAWEQSDNHDYGIPIPLDDFNPSMSDPFSLPPITVDKLTYTVVFNDVNSGTIRLRGYVDIDGVGECEVNADNAIWREGTPRPSVPDTESGCNAGFSAGALAILASCFCLRGVIRSRGGLSS